MTVSCEQYTGRSTERLESKRYSTATDKRPARPFSQRPGGTFCRSTRAFRRRLLFAPPGPVNGPNVLVRLPADPAALPPTGYNRGRETANRIRRGIAFIKSCAASAYVTRRNRTNVVDAFRTYRRVNRSARTYDMVNVVVETDRRDFRPVRSFCVTPAARSGNKSTSRRLR